MAFPKETKERMLELLAETGSVSLAASPSPMPRAEKIVTCVHEQPELAGLYRDATFLGDLRITIRGQGNVEVGCRDVQRHLRTGGSDADITICSHSKHFTPVGGPIPIVETQSVVLCRSSLGEMPI